MYIFVAVCKLYLSYVLQDRNSNEERERETLDRCSQ
jgi:hypothetical protein